VGCVGGSSITESPPTWNVIGSPASSSPTTVWRYDGIRSRLYSSVWKSLLTDGGIVPVRSVSSVPNATIALLRFEEHFLRHTRGPTYRERETRRGHRWCSNDSYRLDRLCTDETSRSLCSWHPEHRGSARVAAVGVACLQTFPVSRSEVW
jgi:hypothetical protein